MMKTLKFGCIGCGGRGALHVLNSKFIPGIEVICYADIKKEKAEKFLKDFGGLYATEEPGKIFADDNIDGVLIQTEERAHPSLGVAAAKAGKHIFMEKPIAVTVEEALERESILF